VTYADFVLALVVLVLPSVTMLLRNGLEEKTLYSTCYL